MIYMFRRRDEEKNTVGAYCDEGPPVPIPNTEVKLIRAEDTRWATARENRSAPTFILLNSKIYAYLAQSVEHAAVNRRVVGSSPTIGAKNPVHISERDFTFYFLPLHFYFK